MSPLGVLEIFYGIPWSEADRLAYAGLLRDLGMKFYIYGPKGDESLRTKWHLPFTAAELGSLAKMSHGFRQHHLQFGVALSPQGLYANFGVTERRRLHNKIQALNDVGLDMLGLFFDDMKAAPNMAEKQVEIAHFVESLTPARLVFCPSYYCDDSLLDMLFGDRPEGYLATLGRDLSKKVEILWTGSEIISREITGEHLQEVAQILRRKPFLCDNFFANDGPLNCGFLRVQPLTGRGPQVRLHTSAWAFNPMTQAGLSRLALTAAANSAQFGVDPTRALTAAIQAHCSPVTAKLLLDHHMRFSEGGLDQLTDAERVDLRRILSQSAEGPFEKELLKWLDGYYTVGFEAVLQQAGVEGEGGSQFRP